MTVGGARPRHLLHDGVAVSFAVLKCEENVVALPIAASRFPHEESMKFAARPPTLQISVMTLRVPIAPCRTWVILSLALCATATAVRAQQVPDTLFVPRVGAPEFAIGTGPRLIIDGAHYNFHTVNGRYRPFAKLMERDGYRVRGNQAPITAAVLKSVDVLVIANALNKRNDGGVWNLPTPSAFTADEIAAIEKWVHR